MAVGENLVQPRGVLPMLAGGTVIKNALCKMSAERTVVVTAGAGEDGIGTALGAQTIGEPIDIATEGVVWCISSAAISLGVRVMATSDGEVVTVGATAATTYKVFGIALGASAADQELIPVLINRYELTTPA